MPKRSAVALRHVPFEDLGLLQPLLERAGYDIAYCDAPVDDLNDPPIERADLLIVLGGPVGVYETDRYPFLVRELEILERRLAKNRPTLGICLGAQLMAGALGARVFPGATKEIGWGTVEVTRDGHKSCLRSLAQGGAVLHWHGDTFDLPAGALRLASTPAYENQAFRFGANALAMQFHLEVVPARFEHWLVGHTVELAAAHVSVPQLRAATIAATHAPTQAEEVFGTWLREIS